MPKNCRQPATISAGEASRNSAEIPGEASGAHEGEKEKTLISISPLFLDHKSSPLYPRRELEYREVADWCFLKARESIVVCSWHRAY